MIFSDRPNGLLPPSSQSSLLNLFGFNCYISSNLKVVPAFVWREHPAGIAARVEQIFKVSSADLAQIEFEFRKGLLRGIEVRRVLRQERWAYIFDQFAALLRWIRVSFQASRPLHTGSEHLERGCPGMKRPGRGISQPGHDHLYVRCQIRQLLPRSRRSSLLGTHPGPVPEYAGPCG